MSQKPPMPSRIEALARTLTEGSVRRPRTTLAAALALTLVLGAAATRLESEVGYAAYFGPDDPAVHRLDAFLAEFQSGLHVLVAFGCPGSRLCSSLGEPAALGFLGRLQAEIDALPNVRSTRSLLNAPIVVAPLETRSVAERDGARYRLAPDFAELVARAPGERFLRGVVVSEDAATAGIVVELQSLASAPLRDSIHALLALLPRFEAELGGEIYAAGDPVWTVVSDDDLDADARNLTLLMFATIAGILWAFFRDLRFTALPLASVAALTVWVHGTIALLGVPMTTILAALPPLLAVIAVTTSVHLLTAFARSGPGDPAHALVLAADEVGPACFWASLTTAAGFASFALSDLASFRHFGLVAAIAFALAFLGTFTLLPALLCQLPGRRVVRVRAGLLREVIAAALSAATGRPRFVLAAGGLALAALAAGIPRLYYEVDFGAQSLVLRSVRFIEANFRGPMTTELALTLPPGARVYDEASLRVLARIEAYFEGERSTGAVWSFLDFLEEAQRVDRGRPAASLEELAASARGTMPIASSLEGLAAFWSEAGEGGRERARVSVHRRWLDGREQIPYLDRLAAFVAALNRELGPAGWQVELAGGLELAARAERRIRETQWTSFGGAFGVVALAMGAALWRSPALLVLGVAANVLPVVALLGCMGWAGVAVDPANAMVAAILLSVAEDDTMHVALRYLRERSAGAGSRAAITSALERVGEPLLVTGCCLALGFAVLMFSRWGGLVSFGLLASLGIVLALVGDLLLVPAALGRRAE